MRTKTLLIAAATLAVGVATSMAQVTYSQNVVGYVNQNIGANGAQIIASQMINGSDVNATNGDVNTSLINGLISSPSGTPNTSSNSQMLVWNGAAFVTYFFYNQADATAFVGDPSDPAGWYDLAANPLTLNLNNGKAVFIKNHFAGSPITVTTVGNVVNGTTNVTTINSGLNLIGLQVPISTNVVSAGDGSHLPYGLPLNMTSQSAVNPTTALNDSLLFWNGAAYVTYFYFNQSDATAFVGDPSDPAGFYDTAGNPMPVNPAVNQGFFLRHIGAAIQWTNTFIVQ